MRRPILTLAISLASLFLVTELIPACAASGEKDSNARPGDGGLFGDGDICGFCLGQLYTPCDSAGRPGTAVECPIDQVCVAQRGCLPCKPGSETCVGNAVHTCNDTGNPGDKVKDCDISKGERCSNGQCKTACEAAAESPSNVGCEFWAVDLDNAKNIIDDAANKPWGLVLSNAGDSTATVTIERNDAKPGEPMMLAIEKTLTIKKDELATVILPSREVDGSVLGNNEGPGTFLSSKALRITATAPLVVYQFNAFEPTFSNDASLLLPRNGLGKIHRVLNYPTSKPIYPGIGPDVRDHAFVTVVGTEAGTNVKVVLGTNIVAGGPITTAKKKGEIVNVTLGPFDVLNLESDGLPGDMTGTIVEADKPVAVFTGTEGSVGPSGANWMSVPKPPDYSGDNCCVDHLEEQVFPVTAMGKKFIITRSPIRSTTSYREPDEIRFLGIAETATVKTTLPAPFDNFTIKPGEMKETWTDKDFIVESSAPLAIGQILLSQNYVAGSYTGDPSLTIFPPVEQYRQNYLFLVPPKWNKNYVVVSAQTGAEVKIDGAVPTGCVIESAGTIEGVAYESRRCPVAAGARRLTGNKPFGVTAYGYGPAGSYAFTGGADVKPIYAPPPLK
jgi:hypothetical protein